MLDKKIILFDVDKTLIDTTSLIHNRIQPLLLETLNLSQEEYEQLYAEYQNSLDKYTDYDSYGLLRFITKTEDVDQLHHQTFGTKQFYVDSVFADTIPVLEQLKTEYRLGIFSEAVLSWQKFKLEMADLTEYFEPEITFIARRKTDKEFLKTLPETVFIIDDNPQVISELEAFNAFKPIWINRIENQAQVNSPTITGLDQLPAILGEYDNY